MADNRESFKQTTHVPHVAVQGLCGSLQSVMQPSRRVANIMAGKTVDEAIQRRLSETWLLDT